MKGNDHLGDRAIFHEKTMMMGGRVGLSPHLDVSENSGTPKSSILIGFSIINHPFWDTHIFGNTHLVTVFLGPHLEESRALSSRILLRVPSVDHGRFVLPVFDASRGSTATWRGMDGWIAKLVS